MIRFLERQCPNLWALLNQSAKRKLPDGIVEFLSGPNASVGEEQLTLADRRIAGLVERTSQTIVGDAYRRRFSSLNSPDALSELLCELTLAEALGGISTSPPDLEPMGKGGKCDVGVVVDGYQLYGEVKRFADPWQRGQRAVIKSIKRPHVDRPRAMDLATKLTKSKVYHQFPDGTLNILFLFHPSWASTHLYIELALFGDLRRSGRASQQGAQLDGLYAQADWQNISACAHTKVNPDDGALSIAKIWKNPKAKVTLPGSVERKLHVAH